MVTRNAGSSITRMKLAFKIAGVFAVVAYLIGIAMYFAPTTWHPSPYFVYALCPPAILTMTVDPSFASVALILAPLNAVVYGGVGLVVGVITDGIRVEISRRSAS